MENIWFFVKEISVPLSAVGTLLMSWCIYRLNSKASKAENYFRHMVEIYYKIEDDYSVIISGMDSYKMNCPNSFILVKEQSLRRIEVNATIMIYYLLRIPGFYKGRWDFYSVISHLSKNPEDMDCYLKLSEKFKELCWELRESKKNMHGFFREYDGKPIIE